MATSTSTPPVVPADWLLRELIAARVMAADRAGTILSEFQSEGVGEDAIGLAEFLVQAGLLTPYQAERAIGGHAAKLVLGPYSLLEPIGSGSMGTVYRAVEQKTRNRVAIKVLPLRSMWNVVQAKRQVQIFSNLPKHPAVVPFLDIDTAAGSHYLAWPFVEGETFENLVRRTGPLPPAHAVRFLAEVADGLAVCHQHNIIHGLLKPANLLLGPDRRARILDLGVGTILCENLADDESLLDTISTANTAMNMMDCAAPETLANPVDRTQAGDLYSLGCVAYYLLTGVYPFPDGNAVDKMIAHQTQQPVPIRTRVAGVPEALADVVTQLMQKSPANRPANLEEVNRALFLAVPDEVRDVHDLPTPVVEDVAHQNQSMPWQEVSDLVASLEGIAQDRADEQDSVNFDDTKGVETSPNTLVVFDPSLDTPTPSQNLSAIPNDTVPLQPARMIVLQSKPGDYATQPAPAERRKPTKSQLKPVVANVEIPPMVMNWTAQADNEETTLSPVVVPPPPLYTRSPLWRLKKLFCFWLPPRDTIQLSLFGPSSLSPGQTYRFQVYTHPPEAFTSVCTLSRAFQPDTDLRGAGYADRHVPRGEELGIHLAVANAGVKNSLVRFQWLGQTKPWAFDVYVPWESPSGVTPGMLTIGLNNTQVARIPFEVMVLPRSG